VPVRPAVFWDGFVTNNALKAALPSSYPDMRYAILLLATGFFTVGSGQNALLQQPNGPSRSLVVAAACEAARADANRVGAATLDILSCDRPSNEPRDRARQVI
jgi:hypothetical protein